MKPKAYVINGLGIGCHKEVAHAFEKAGAEAEIVHYRQLLSGSKKLYDSQILNLSGGFFHGDILGAGMCAANELEHARPTEEDEKRIKELLIEYAKKGNVIYGQCNGFQLLVKTGLLPGINDYEQIVTLTHNDCRNYFVAPAPHIIEKYHFAFDGVDDSDLYLWCRHGEGKLQFHSDSGLISAKEAEDNRGIVDPDHVLLRYVDPETMELTKKFPYNPNGSVDGIAGLVDHTGNIIGHMAHTEVGVYISRDPRFFMWKDEWRRQGIKAEDIDEKRLEGVCLKIFKNIVEHVR